MHAPTAETIAPPPQFLRFKPSHCLNSHFAYAAYASIEHLSLAIAKNRDCDVLTTLNTETTVEHVVLVQISALL